MISVWHRAPAHATKQSVVDFYHGADDIIVGYRRGVGGAYDLLRARASQMCHKFRATPTHRGNQPAGRTAWS